MSPSKLALRTDSQGRCRILYVEGDPDARSLYAGALRATGADVIETHDGDEALALVDAEPIALVIADLWLPGLDGAALAESIKKLRDVPVILLSAPVASSTVIACFERGVDDFLQKPIAPAELTARAGRHLEAARRLAALRDAAIVDELTGACNRRGVVMALEREMARAERLEAALAIQLIDVDHFKNINDRFGHGVGDQVLRDIAGEIHKAVRSADVVGRLGGDEFLVVLPDVREEGVATIARRIMHRVNKITVCDSSMRTEISIGCHFQPPPVSGSAQDLIDRADAAMYRNKRSRRGRHLHLVR